MNIWSPELSTYLSFPQVPITMTQNPLDDPDFDDDLDDDDTDEWVEVVCQGAHLILIPKYLMITP